MVIATQNPQGFVRTYPLPEAQLDRFALKINMGYPTADQETQILTNRKGVNPLDSVQAVTDVAKVEKMRNTVANLTIDDEICKYIVSLVSETRRSKSLSLGASPRASLALMRMSQAWAFMQGREYVIPEDVKAVYRYVIAHRIVLTQEAKLGHETADSVLSGIVSHTDVPFRGKRDDWSKREVKSEE